MIRLKCNNCGKIYQFEDAELDYECVGSDPDRQMGPEHEYSGKIELSCDRCRNQLIVEFNFWEYPSLVLNYAEYNVEGCLVLEEPDYNKYLNDSELNGYEE